MLAALSAPVAADQGDALTIMVMKHACAEGIATEADFEAVEAKGEGNPVAALAQTVLACPTIVRSADTPSEGAVAGAPIDYEFTVTDSAGTSVSSADAEIMVAKLCESDIDLDANGDGTVSADVCLDISHYNFTGLVSGEITVEETVPPAGHEYGTVRFTPDELGENNDDESLLSDVTEEPLQLDTSGDTDNAVMLHVYNFRTAGEGGGMSMPPTDTSATHDHAGSSAVGTTSLIAVGLALLASLGVAGAVATQRVRARN
jgi:hypothetical protein